MTYRTGIGHDIHRLVPGRRLVLGGIEVPFDRGLHGHSDADVVLHAVCDALLGAAGLPDIGELFPDSDAAYKDADSSHLLRTVLAKVSAAGFAVENLDLVILAEQPKLGPLKERIRASIAGMLGVETSRVGVKAGTNEGLDAVGSGQAIACWATVLLRTARNGA